MSASNPFIYFRSAGIENLDETEAINKYFKGRWTKNRVYVDKGDLVIPRYSCLPFYEELESDVKLKGGKLINTYAEHRFVADITQWAPVLGDDLTPKTYTTWNKLPEGAYVLKGRTNSRKHEWNRRMFAPTREDVPKVAALLLDDDLIKDQGVVCREYVKLEQLGVGINGMPVSNEWRVFVLDDHVLDYGFYWASHPECINKATAPDIGLVNEILDDVIDRATSRVLPRFYVIDIARTAEGNWIVIELNDAQMAGLSTIPADRFYKRLKDELS